MKSERAGVQPLMAENNIANLPENVLSSPLRHVSPGPNSQLSESNGSAIELTEG
jgi:hypothetical protein